jgi:hypothetical protein
MKKCQAKAGWERTAVHQSSVVFCNRFAKQIALDPTDGSQPQPHMRVDRLGRYGSCVFSLRCGPTDWCRRSDTVINHAYGNLTRASGAASVDLLLVTAFSVCGLLGARLVAELVIAAASVIHSSLACAHGPTSHQCGNNFWVIVVIDDIFNLASRSCANFVKPCKITLRETLRRVLIYPSVLILLCASFDWRNWHEYSCTPDDAKHIATRITNQIVRVWMHVM